MIVVYMHSSLHLISYLMNGIHVGVLDAYSAYSGKSLEMNQHNERCGALLVTALRNGYNMVASAWLTSLSGAPHTESGG